MAQWDKSNFFYIKKILDSATGSTVSIHFVLLVIGYLYCQDDGTSYTSIRMTERHLRSICHMAWGAFPLIIESI